MANIKGLIGKTIVAITGEKGGYKIYILMDDGKKYKMGHAQDCCESVSVEDIDGDLSDLIGSPILLAEEIVADKENPDGIEIPEYRDDSWAWTFYKLATIKGSVTIRW